MSNDYEIFVERKAYIKIVRAPFVKSTNTICFPGILLFSRPRQCTGKNTLFALTTLLAQIYISTKLVLLMEYLNNYALDAIPGKTVSVVSNFMAFISSILVGFLAWVNQFLLRRDESEESKTKSGKNRRVD